MISPDMQLTKGKLKRKTLQKTTGARVGRVPWNSIDGAEWPRHIDGRALPNDTTIKMREKHSGASML